MTKLNIHEAKTHLSKYLLKVEEGETVLLCRNGKPVAQIVPLSKGRAPKRRRLGLAKGMGKVTAAFFEPLSERDLPGFGL
ncbi:MAG: type II toxin-antitoxin system Phd/YefM family antitoxin [Deltaproteobacteria bacterium]|nr:type II toxin-antitoxin system Phd/YefM family antitoxin [Deltaproteobacteria bacterium]